MQRHVPDLGGVEGIGFEKYPKVEQYLGIPYASVPARFRQSKLVTSLPGGKWDGTKYGPICPFPKWAIGGSIVQKPLPALHNYDFNEFECLNLNVTCPKGSTSESNLPVVVWVHGGGNCIGSGSEAGYDGAPLVNFSVENGLSVVVVTINYRLGVFGFLASDEIQKDNEAAGDKGVGNYGIRDQLVAYEWVKKNIKAFGGDPTRVTAMGESAGSIDIHITLCSEMIETALPFHQAILQSGVAPLTVRSLKHQQGTYDKIATFLKVPADASPEDSIKALRGVPADDLINSYMPALRTPVPSWQGTVDGYFLKNRPRTATIASQQYHPSVKRLLIGDCAQEGLIFAMPLQHMGWTYEKLQPLAVKKLGEKDAQEVLQAYGLTTEASPPEFFDAIIKLISDAEWSQPIQTVAKSFSNGDVFYYHMAEGNPFDGPNKSKAHHTVDLLYIFLTYQEHLPKALGMMAENLATHWLTFINGGTPWTPYAQSPTGDSTVMFYSGGGKNGEAAEKVKPAFRTLQMCERLQNRISELGEAMRGENVID